MSLTTKLVLFSFFIFFMLLMAFNNRKRKKKVIFFGDSITEAGALFGGFIQRIATYLQDQDLAGKYDLAAMGKSGNKVTDLYERISRDILERGADLVIILIGVNDVWHKYTHHTGTDLIVFEKVYESIIEKLKIAGIKTILCTPAVIGESMMNSTEADTELEKFCGVILNLAQKHQLPLVNLREAFKNYLCEYNIENAESGILTRDGVHLNDKGNVLVAEEIWKVFKNEIPQLK